MKTTCYQYQVHGQVLQQVTPAKYLGVTIQSDTKVGPAHQQYCVRGNPKNPWVSASNLKIGALQTKELAYKSLVKSLLEYASTVWYPTTQRGRLEAVRRRAARFVLSRQYNTSSVGEMLQSLNWPSLEQWGRT